MSADIYLVFSLGYDNINFGLIVRVLGQPVVANHDGVHPEQKETQRSLRKYKLIMQRFH